MIQDIAPSVYDRDYAIQQPDADSVIILLREDKILGNLTEGQLTLPRLREFKTPQGEFRYLFRIDKTEYFLAMDPNANAAPGFESLSPFHFRTAWDKPAAFGALTAFHLARWYHGNRYCGKCGGIMQPGKAERSLICPSCGNTVYPQIAPAILVAVTHNGKLLMTRYAQGAYLNYALIAGFCEIGETLEDTVRREVMEEVGLRVKNITYYKSQPWSLTSCLLCGFFAQLEGEPDIMRDPSELAEADWFGPEVIDGNDDGVSLTREMMLLFRAGNYPK